MTARHAGAGRIADQPWHRALDKGKVTINCLGTGLGTHADCHGWANPGSEVTYCSCSCHSDSTNPRWDYSVEAERIWGPSR